MKRVLCKKANEREDFRKNCEIYVFQDSPVSKVASRKDRRVETRGVERNTPW
jgi:hypothetical protein